MSTQRKQLCFKGQSIYVGIDVHLKSWSVTVMSSNTTLKTFSQDPKPEALVSFLKNNYPGADYYSVYESGFCGFWIHYRLLGLGVQNIVVNAADVPTTVGEKVRKTDAVDSAKLARSLRGGELVGIYVPDVVSTEIRSLVRLRELITKDQTRQKNRIKSHLHFFGVDIPPQYLKPGCGWNNGFVSWMRCLDCFGQNGKQTLDFLIDQYEALRLQRLNLLKSARNLSKTERFEKQMDLLLSVPGIGQVTALEIISEIIDIKRFKNSDHLASYIGLVPMTHDSGEHICTGEITVRKNTRLRTAMIESAWVAIRQDPAMTAAYEEYCKRMKPGKAIVKIARKLSNRIFYVMKHETEYVTCVVQ